MQREWKPEELIACWTLVEEDWRLLANKTGVTRLGFTVILKYFEIEGRFPRYDAEVPRAAVDYVAAQVKVAPEAFGDYQWSGRTIEYHRAQIRKALGFREATVGDEDKLAAWLAEHVCPVELSDDRLREALVARCRAEQLEPPAPSRVDRVIGTARAAFDQRFTTEVASRLSQPVRTQLEAFVAEADEAGFLAELKADPAKPGIETLLVEIEKLARVKAVGLPAELFTGFSEKLVDAWRARAARLYPSDLRASPSPVRLTLLAALCWARQTEIIDGLVDLLITLVHKVDATAERKVGGELLDNLRRVRGKQGILFAVAEAALDHPDDTVRVALYPVVSEATLKDLVAEARANDTVFRQRVRTVLRSSYSAHYRRMLPKLLAALDFRCNNTSYRPVMDALGLLRRYSERASRERFYAEGENVPLDGVVPREWRDGVVDEAGQVERIPYELCVLRSLREAIRRREIYVAGANRWRNPEDDLPADFEANREMHYAAIRQPLDPTAFVDDLRSRMRDALTRLDEGIAAGTTGGVRITTRRGEPWISVPSRKKLPEPANLVALKDEVARRWGVLDLLDVLKEADFDAGFTEEFASVALGLAAMVVSGTPRDSLHVIDLLYRQEAGRRPEVIVGDTGSCSDMVFALLRLLGLDYRPQLADLPDAKLWRIDLAAQYGALDGAARGRIDLDRVRRHWGDICRLVASVHTGAVSAHDVIRMLAPSGKATQLGDALSHYGRIFKTMHVLAYVDDEAYRRQIKGVRNLQEGRHSLARHVFHGGKGELRQHYHEGMEDQLGALGLVLNCITLWNTVYLDAALARLRASGYPVREEDVARLSAYVRRHLNVHGHYSFQLPELAAGRRALRDPDGPEDEAD